MMAIENSLTVPSKTEFRFGDRTLWPNVFLSPMAGVSDLPFRRLFSELSGGRISLFVSEFVSARAIVNSRRRELRGMRFDRSPTPFCMQLFGGDPAVVGEAVQIIQDLGIDFIEINSGCPVAKMVRKGGGAQLLRDLPRFREVLKRARAATTLPLSVKVRLGWSEGERTLMETLEISQGEGVDLFVVHGRTREQGYSGEADWEAIAEAKAKASIPLVGNGDLRSVDEIVRRLSESGVDAVAVGRGAVHNPWLLGQIADRWSGKREVLPTAEAQWNLYRRYDTLMEEDGMTPLARLGRLKLLAARMFRAVSDADELRLELVRSLEREEFFSFLERFYAFKKSSGFAPELLKDLNG